jgi:2-polyprenyl-3-methyl-5-hydroxy-6-metoxy-1,4-benzoquinol methylase
MLEWYDNLSAARGINSVDDVKKLTAIYSSGYGRLLHAVLPTQKDAPIYDAGCGPGLTLNILRSLGYTNLEGTDLSGDAISLAKGLGFNANQANSIEHLAAKENGSYRCIFGVDLIEHLDKPDLLRFIQIVRSKLMPGGVLILRCPNGDSPLVGRHLFNDVTHIWTYTSTALSVILTMNKFSKMAFLDETVPFITKMRGLKGLIIRSNAFVLRRMIRLATRESIAIFAPSFWIVAGTD